MNGKKQAALFGKNFRLKTINSATLREALNAQGYTVVEYNGISEKPAVADLIDALRLHDQVSHSKCFVYQDENNRLVFLNEDLNDEERTIVLAHEAGHIWNRHMLRESVMGDDVIQEYEANEFAHYLLLDRAGVSGQRLVVSIVCVFCAILCASGFFLHRFHDKSIYTENLYRVSNGEKYHLRNCAYIKDRKDVSRLTWEEYESGKYTPCSVCKPEAEHNAAE